MPSKGKVGSRPHEFKYGMALYGAAWPPGDHFFVCGGGGHGLVNRIVWAAYRGGRCSDQVGEYKLGAATPMRMALAPSGSGLILGMSDGGLRRFQLDLSGQVPRVIEVSASFAERMAALRDEVTAMGFSGDGGLMGVGFANGRLVVLEYPSMKLLAEWRLPDGVKDLDFASVRGGPAGAGPLLAATCEDGKCSLWDVASSTQLCTLQLPKGMDKAHITRCRFSKAAPIVYVVINQPRAACHVAAYGPSAESQRRATAAGGGQQQQQATGGGAAPGGGGGDGEAWVLLKRHEVDSGPNAAMEISPSGRLLALGQAEGGLLIVGAHNLHVVKSEPCASMVFVTRVAFANDDSRVLAVGGDANAFVMDLEQRGGGGGGGACLALLVLLLLLAAGLAYAIHTQPEAAAAAQSAVARAGDLWEQLASHEKLGPAARAAQAQAQQLAGRFAPAPRDEL